MYVPADFQVSDRETILSFLKKHPFGMLCATGENGFPSVAHLPFLLKANGDEWVLEVHMAAANGLSEVLSAAETAMMIIQGAHGYVSSSVYTHVNVPTYNYQAVHLSGTVVRMERDALLQHLKEVVGSFEKNREHPINFRNWPEEMINGYLSEIVGYRMKINTVEAAFKLSQNRNETDFERILADLNGGDMNDQQLAAAMLETRKYH